MSTNLKITVGLLAAGIVAIAILAGTLGSSDPDPGGQTDGGSVPVVRENSHRLSEAREGDVTLVEFLDFECEGCRAAYPFVEQLRTEYGDRVTFVARYFPLSGHANSVNAAVAVEAAAQQGQFEGMYHIMFETQPSWGEKQESQAHIFREFAESLDLDMAAYDRAVADPATVERVELDRRDGLALGVQGTPTFFLNGQPLNPASAAEFIAAIEAALEG